MSCISRLPIPIDLTSHSRSPRRQASWDAKDDAARKRHLQKAESQRQLRDHTYCLRDCFGLTSAVHRTIKREVSSTLLWALAKHPANVSLLQETGHSFEVPEDLELQGIARDKRVARIPMDQLPPETQAALRIPVPTSDATNFVATMRVHFAPLGLEEVQEDGRLLLRVVLAPPQPPFFDAGINPSLLAGPAPAPPLPASPQLLAPLEYLAGPASPLAFVGEQFDLGYQGQELLLPAADTTAQGFDQAAPSAWAPQEEREMPLDDFDAAVFTAVAAGLDNINGGNNNNNDNPAPEPAPGPAPPADSLSPEDSGWSSSERSNSFPELEMVPQETIARGFMPLLIGPADGCRWCVEGHECAFHSLRV